MSLAIAKWEALAPRTATFYGALFHLWVFCSPTFSFLPQRESCQLVLLITLQNGLYLTVQECSTLLLQAVKLYRIAFVFPALEEDKALTSLLFQNLLTLQLCKHFTVLPHLPCWREERSLTAEPLCQLWG